MALFKYMYIFFIFIGGFLWFLVVVGVFGRCRILDSKTTFGIYYCTTFSLLLKLHAIQGQKSHIAIKRAKKTLP